jgi:hypothetical protein
MMTSLRLLAPYLAVGVFWCWLRNGWLAILSYHALILLLRQDWPRWSGRLTRTEMLLAAPSVVAGPILYVLLPDLAETPIATWLAGFGLSGISLVLLIPYFGLVHPFLEQAHWAPLCRRSVASHFCFYGYHVLVLASLLSPVWLIGAFVVLVGASLLWEAMRQRTLDIKAAVLSHMLADTGIILAAFAGS